MKKFLITLAFVSCIVLAFICFFQCFGTLLDEVLSLVFVYGFGLAFGISGAVFLGPKVMNLYYD